MNISYRIKGNWNAEQLELLRSNKLNPERPYIILSDEEFNLPILNKIQNSIVEKTAVFAVFSISDLSNAEYFVLKKQQFPNLTYPYEGDTKYGNEYLEHAFGDVCMTHNIPKSEQFNPLVLKTEPRALPKGLLFGTVHWSPGYIITDIPRANLIESKFNIGHLPLLIGKDKVVSKNYVQLNIPISESLLNFGSSKFAEFDECTKCGLKSHKVKQLDFFPNFQEKVSEKICFTKEWFGYYRQLVVNREVIEFLLTKTKMKFTSEFLIPVKTQMMYQDV